MMFKMVMKLAQTAAAQPVTAVHVCSIRLRANTLFAEMTVIAMETVSVLETV